MTSQSKAVRILRQQYYSVTMVGGSEELNNYLKLQNLTVYDSLSVFDNLGQCYS
jgi:hypothetical protein